MSQFFNLLHRSKKSKARLGEIHSSHGNIKTPGFIAAATKGTIKTLTPDQVKEIGIQAACVNTYHLVTHPGADIIAKAGGIQKYSNLNVFTMSDSGGFQVFSLARSQSKKDSISSRRANVRGEEEPILVKISEDGVKFRSTFDGSLIEFTPEKSMEYQTKIGADINMAFDECTYYPATHEYAEKAMNRTHEWLRRCIGYRKDSELKFLSRVNSSSEESSSSDTNSRKNFNSSSITKQYLYGVIQGATFEDLRKKSAEFVVAQNTPGVAIGGVSVGESKKEMRDQVRWVSDYLPDDRPVHLLGVGQVDDIVDLVKYGIDTFDCVEPTRLARMGVIYQSLKGKKIGVSKELDITRAIYKNNLEPVDMECKCYVCKNFTKSYLHHLFKQREILGYNLATYHNLWIMEKLFENIRTLIQKDLI